MSALRDEILAANGGADRWKSLSAISASGKIGGLLPLRFSGNKLARFSVRALVAQQHTVFTGFPRAGNRIVFDLGEVRVETEEGMRLANRTNPRSAFFGLSGARRNVHWDALDVAYFAGYAMWNYLMAIPILARDDIALRECEPWQENGERWRRLEATFPVDFHTHNRRQTFYVDAKGLVRRHDFLAEPVGMWAKAALYCDAHREIEGLTFPFRRTVFPRMTGTRVLRMPTLLALDFDDIALEW